MKAAVITAIAALATSVVAAPTKITDAVGTVTQALSIDSLAAPTASVAASSNNIVQDLGSEVHDILAITGPNAKRLLIQLSPEVAGLLSTLQLPALGTAVGSIVASASSLGDLVANLGPHTENLLTVVDADGSYLLIELAPGLAGLLSGLGLPAVGTPVGSVVATVGENLKRDGMLVGDVVPEVRDVLEVTGPNAERLLIQLAPEAAALVSGLGLPNIGKPVGEIVTDASSIGQAVKDLGVPVEQLLSVVGADGKSLVIKLAPDVASLLSGLGLSGVDASVGSIVATLGANL
ncbi:hypothetical protein BJY04DRAFT_28546 [Aspergillus karnatakaensis]|uniref:uncharacterized protein n=1 Tax=Aspergillus karnatakaensis TaxID=1810916 RepID=UPI003CCDECE8